jgi:hypothetical protein
MDAIGKKQTANIFLSTNRLGNVETAFFVGWGI